MKRFLYSCLSGIFILGVPVLVKAQAVNPTDFNTAETGIYSWDAQNAQDSIDYSRSLASKDIQIEYLKYQARALISQQDYNEAQRVLQFLENELDVEPNELQEIVEEAGPEYEAAGAEVHPRGMEDRDNTSMEEDDGLMNENRMEY